MRIDGSDIKPGVVLDMDGKLWLVTKNEIRATGRGRSGNHVEMKDIVGGTKQVTRFTADERLERAELFARPYQYLYAEDNQLHFMDQESYEQIIVEKEMLGESIAFLQDDMIVTIERYDDKPVLARLPETVAMEIAQADPVVKGQTASSSYKPAVLVNGVKVQVPQFIASGEIIVVRTSDATYMERAKSA